MFCKLYLKRKFQKTAAEYICVFIIMIISMILINIPSILIDSIDYGESLHALEKTGGYDAVLIGALSGDLKYLDEVEGITAKYQNGNIYITVSPSVDKDYTINHISYIVNINDLNLEVHSYSVSDSAPSELVALISVIQLIFTLFGMVTIYLSYTLLLHYRKKEIETLIKIGIQKKTLRNTLLVELVLVFLPAMIIASISSTFIMKFLITTLFQKSSHYVWIVFNYEISSQFLLIIYSLSAIIAAFILSWRKMNVGINGEYYRSENYHCRYIHANIGQNKISARIFLTRVNLFREIQYSFPCGLVTIITVILITVIIQYSGSILSTTNDTDFTITANAAELYNRSEEIENAFSELNKVQHIEKIEYIIDYNGFVAVLNTVKSTYETYAIANNERYTHISLKVLDKSKYGELDLMEAVVPEGTKMSIFPSGKLILHSRYNLSAPDYKHDTGNELSVKGTIDIETNSNFLNMYVSEETFNKLTGHPPVIGKAYVQLEDSIDVNLFFNEIIRIFADESLFTVTNNNEIFQEQRNNDILIVIIMIVLSALILLCGSIMIYVFITLEALKNEPNVRKLIRIGAGYKDILKSLLCSSGLKALFFCTVGFIVGGVIILGITFLSNMSVELNVFNVLCSLLLLMVVSLIYITPVYFMVHKHIKWRS